MDRLLAALRAAAEPTRLRLLALCGHGELTVSELTQILGQSQPRVSRHLKLLDEAGLLERFREGSWAFYRLAQEGPAGELARHLIDQIPADDEALTLDLARLEQVRQSRAEQAAAYFRSNAADWDRIRALHIDERDVEAALLRHIDGDVEDHLDIGTGTGRLLVLLAQRAKRGVGIDASREMLQVARANLDKAGCAQCTVRQGDMYQLPFPPASFDLVTIHQVLHFADAPDEAIAEAARVLKPDGQLVIVDFAPHGLEELRSAHAHRRLGFAREEVEGWCRQAGLEPAAAELLPGTALAVTVWSARRPLLPAGRAKPRAAAHSPGHSPAHPQGLATTRSVQ